MMLVPSPRCRLWWWWLIFLLLRFISLASVVKCCAKSGGRSVVVPAAEQAAHRSARAAVEEQEESASSPGDRFARSRNNKPKKQKKQKKIDVYLAQLHAAADLDDDGKVSFTECYARILLFYVYLNRQADLEPPTRSDLAVLYQRAGWDSTNDNDQQPNKKGLNADEFTRLAKTLLSRAASRLLVHKIVTIALAPYVALSIVHALDDAHDSRRSSWGGMMIVARLRQRLWQHPYRHHLPNWIYQPLTKRSFWLSICMVLCIKLLPHFAISLMDYFFDAAHSPFVRRYLDVVGVPSSPPPPPAPPITTADHNDEIMTTTTTTVDRNGSATTAVITVDQ
jgi:hypothetical protein